MKKLFIIFVFYTALFTSSCSVSDLGISNLGNGGAVNTIKLSNSKNNELYKELFDLKYKGKQAMDHASKMHNFIVTHFVNYIEKTIYNFKHNQKDVYAVRFIEVKLCKKPILDELQNTCMHYYERRAYIIGKLSKTEKGIIKLEY